jgi:hypothetical protein
VGNFPQASPDNLNQNPTDVPLLDPSSSYVTPEAEDTIFDMAPTQGFIDYQKRKRLDALRPKPTFTPMEKSESTYSAAPLLESVVTQIPSCEEQQQLVRASLSTLDRGRISLREAMKRFGWNQDTSLDFTCDGRTITIFQVEEGRANLSLSQSRLTLNLAMRRRLGLPDDGQVLVMSHSQPIPHVRVVPIAQIAEQLQPEGDL